MNKQYLIRILFILIWLVTVSLAGLWGYENPEKFEAIKSYFKKNKLPQTIFEKSEGKEVIANSFSIEFSKVISFSEKTAFIINNDNFLKFNESSTKIYFQNGYMVDGGVSKKLNLPESFTLKRNGGIKTIFFNNKKSFALISSFDKNCYYASLISLETSDEIFKTKCLPDTSKKIDFNGLGSSAIHLNEKIYLIIGTPEQHSSKISMLAQNKKSMFGKIFEIDKNDLKKLNFINGEKLNLKTFTMGHRAPQGLTKIDSSIFNVEHGPKGGDELNKVESEKNYGWPLVSYGTRYHFDNNGKSFDINHEINNFEEPLFALVPSVGISALNKCPKKIHNFYKKPCLIALSLSGNNLRKGRSLLIFLLNEDLNQVHSIEKIYLSDDLRLRHFVTNSKNEIYEDNEGSIYISADKTGIFRIKFFGFR
jgi:hypothetical protein